ncbi:hypothetical protein OOZ15_16365 [Galbibacter sp. EGI 63066]|uniref:hypothetical protein n=1 Tax=Galbibacter sp. EGI 63066 TaxID=2993559 RepID=UPI002248B68C|nr:hypothetical protein [Galbibacter sp. EGI 63066]MCX2681529.1 hypothetical protein [Galbibacter sp. EGI 63066]
MSLKTKAFIYNMIGFIAIFLIVRFSLLYLFSLNHLILVLIAAFSASILSPKFAVVTENGVEKIKMKWIFLKGFRDVK